MLAEIKGSQASIFAPNKSVIYNCSWKTKYVLRGIPLACVAVLAENRGWRQRWSTSFFSNKIQITCGIHKDLYCLFYKNHLDSLSASKIFVFRLTMTQTNLCSRCIRPGFFALFSIAGFFLTLRLFVTVFQNRNKRAYAKS